MKDSIKIAIAGATGQSPGPLGSAHPLTAPYQAFKTKTVRFKIHHSPLTLWLDWSWLSSK